ncbi:MAG TPA: hypothetical protein VM120_18900 [Bryobacteraceae bacterium]|nr:hypothetical protein [Bryobacteraceae bacterium]
MDGLRDMTPDSSGACPRAAAGELVPMAKLSPPPGLPPPIITRGVPAAIGIPADSVRRMAPAEAAALRDMPGGRTCQNYDSGARPLDGSVALVVSDGALAEARGSRLAAGYTAMPQARPVHLEVRE